MKNYFASLKSRKTILGILTSLILVLTASGVYFSPIDMGAWSQVILGEGSVQTSTFYSSQVWNLSNSAEKSDMIITGEVAQVKNAEWNTSDGKRPDNITSKDVAGIHHEVVINIDKVVKGPEKERIALRVDTGRIGRYNTQSSSAAEYHEGERVLVYVQRWRGHYQTFGQKYGKFNLDNKVIERNINGPYRETLNLTRVIERQKQLYGSE